MSPHTVWLASYPKSGNTWVRALLTALLIDEGELDINRLGHGPIASARGVIERHTGVVSSDLTTEENATLRLRADLAFDAHLTKARYRKIHDALFSAPGGSSIVAPEATLGAVYVVRDPRDVAISFAHHCGRSVEWAVKRMGDHNSGFGRAQRDISAQLPQYLGSWSEHVSGWIDHTLFPVIVVRYEDLHADPAAQLTRIAELGQLEVTSEAVEHAAQVTAFEQLRKGEETAGFRERSGLERRFFRRGIVGAWRDELPLELAEQIVTDHGEMMHRLGYVAG